MKPVLTHVAGPGTSTSSAFSNLREIGEEESASGLQPLCISRQECEPKRTSGQGQKSDYRPFIDPLTACTKCYRNLRQAVVLVCVRLGSDVDICCTLMMFMPSWVPSELTTPNAECKRSVQAVQTC